MDQWSLVMYSYEIDGILVSVHSIQAYAECSNLEYAQYTWQAAKICLWG